MERPVPSGAGEAGFGSDVVAETLRALDIPYIALNPGASFRGLHDSLVNHLGNRAAADAALPARGAGGRDRAWLRQGDRPGDGGGRAFQCRPVPRHHGACSTPGATACRCSCIGATGPVDAAKRRPWIDWIHTARDQGAIVRGYTKWDDQPASPEAAREALLRAAWIANTRRMGPTYVVLDAGLQEASLTEPLPPLDAAPLRRRRVAAGAPPEIDRRRRRRCSRRRRGR